MILNDVEKLIKEKYSKCIILKDVVKLQEDIQQINNLVASDTWTELCTKELD